MDISLLKTFLELSKTRHFGKAAEHLCLTQSAVSARIKLLESDLGVELFSRKRNDIHLTPAGLRLLEHARPLVDGWERARQCVALDETFTQSLSIGALGDIWSVHLFAWVERLRLARPHMALQLASLNAAVLQQQLAAGLIDLAFLFEPAQSAEFVVREVTTLPLLMVSTQAGIDVAAALGEGYIMIDWGESFARAHSSHFPGMATPALRVNQGNLALGLLQQRAGSTYLPEPMVASALEQGLLHRVTGAPTMERILYASYRADNTQQSVIREVLAVE